MREKDEIITSRKKDKVWPTGDTSHPKGSAQTKSERTEYKIPCNWIPKEGGIDNSFSDTADSQPKLIRRKKHV